MQLPNSHGALGQVTGTLGHVSASHSPLLYLLPSLSSKLLAADSLAYHVHYITATLYRRLYLTIYSENRYLIRFEKFEIPIYMQLLQ